MSEGRLRELMGQAVQLGRMEERRSQVDPLITKAQRSWHFAFGVITGAAMVHFIASPAIVAAIGGGMFLVDVLVLVYRLGRKGRQ